MLLCACVCVCVCECVSVCVSTPRACVFVFNMILQYTVFAMKLGKNYIIVVIYTGCSEINFVVLTSTSSLKKYPPLGQGFIQELKS